MAAEAASSEWTPQITIDAAALMPDSFIADLDLRLAMYKRLASLEEAQDIEEFRIGILGGENTQDRMNAFSCLGDYTTEALGVPTKLFAPADYNGVIQGLLGGTLDMAWLGASSYAATYLQDPICTGEPRGNSGERAHSPKQTATRIGKLVGHVAVGERLGRRCSNPGHPLDDGEHVSTDAGDDVQGTIGTFALISWGMVAVLIATSWIAREPTADPAAG